MKKSSTSHDAAPGRKPVPYLLTPDEEQAAIAEAIERKKSHIRWQALDRGFEDPGENIAIEIDRDAVLDAANRAKNWREQDRRLSEQRTERERQARFALRQQWKAENMYALLRSQAKKLGIDFQVNDGNKNAVQAACFRLSDDPRYQADLGLDPCKGIMLRGSYGVGKTFLIQCLMQNPIHPIRMVSMIDIARTIRESGRYNLPLFASEHDLLYLDDVGTELEDGDIKHYGSSINFFRQFIESFYANGARAFNRLIISTNDSFDELERKYGGKVRSRLPAMFNIIDVGGTDFRRTSINHLQL